MSDSDSIDCPNCDVELIADAAVHAQMCGYCPKCGEYLDPDDERNDGEDGDDEPDCFGTGGHTWEDDFCVYCGVDKPLWNEDTW